MLTDEQVVELVKQLPLKRKYEVLKVLHAERQAWWEKTLAEGEQQMRRLCIERGRDWDTLSEDDREALVDELMHEDR
jgi:hypothetical protein